MPFGSGEMPAGGAGVYSKTLLTIIGAACTSEKFRYFLFHDTDRVFAMYPELKNMTKDEQDTFKVLTAKREAPNAIELAIAKVHATFITFNMPCTYPSHGWKLDPSEEMLKKQ